MIKKFLRERYNLLLAVLVLSAIVITQFFPMIEVKALSEDTKAQTSLEELYKNYVKKFGDKTTSEGLQRIYDSSFEVNGSDFSYYKSKGYSVEMTSTVIRPVDGAKDKDGIITPARDGYANISAKLIKDGNEVGNVNINEVIKADMVTLTYEKSSAESGGGTWSVGMGIYLNSYTGNADKLIIPEGVEELNYSTRTNWYNGDKTKVKIIIFPSTMKQMFPETLQGFTNLVAVYIPDGCKSLGQSVMANCPSLRYVRLPETLETIGDSAFMGSTALTQLYIPASVKNIKENAFKNSALKDVVITNKDFAGEGTDTFIMPVNEVKSEVSEQVKAAVKEDITNDMGDISKRNIFIIGKNATSSASWQWFTTVADSSCNKYIMVYSVEGSDLTDKALNKQKRNFTGRFTLLNAEEINTITEQHDIIMKSGRYPVELDKELINDTVNSFVFSNKTNSAELVAALENVVSDFGYTVRINNWTTLNSVPGCKDDSGVLFKGYDGYVSGTLLFNSIKGEIEIPLSATIKPEMYEYTFATTAKATDFYKKTIDGINGYVGETNEDGEYFLISEDGDTLLDYFGTAEKIIIPEGVKYLDPSWWLDTDLSAVRCIILPDSLTALPDQFAVPFCKNIEVVIMGDNVTKAEGRYTFRKCYRLKNLRLSERLENLNEEALFETLLLTDLHLPNNLKRIDKGAMHLTALRNIVVPSGVEFIDAEAFAWPLRKLQFLTPEVRTQGNAVDNEIVDELEPIFQEKVKYNNGILMPRNIVILSENAKFGDTVNYWNSHASWCPIIVRYVAGSTTEALINSGYGVGEIYSYQKLDMDADELKCRVTSAVNRVPIDETTGKDDIIAFVKSQISSESMINDLDIADYKIENAGPDKEGSSSGVISFSMKNGKNLSIPFNRSFNSPKHYSIDESKGGWNDLEDQFASRFVPNITLFDNINNKPDEKNNNDITSDNSINEGNQEDYYTNDVNESESDNNSDEKTSGENIEQENSEDGNEEKTVIRRVKKKKKTNKTDSSLNTGTVVAIILVGVLAVAAVVIVVLKKKKILSK